MKTTHKRMTALFLVLLMTASLLASCSGGGESKNTPAEVGEIPVYDHYKSEKIDLGLAENETVFDIIEIDGQLRATIGVLDPEYKLVEGSYTPYRTEYRWYSMDFVEDTAKREKTKAHQEIIRVADPNVDFALGGEPDETKEFDGLQYYFYRDGEPIGEEIVPPAGIHDPEDRAYYASAYSPLAHVLLYDDVAYAWINCGTKSNGVTYRDDLYNDLYVNGNIIDTYVWKPGMPKDFGFFGIIGLEGVPYALLSADGKGRLAPLTPETTELPTEGKSIDVIPTGGACSDDRFGYFMSNTELWRTDGEECVLLVDMVVYGAINTSGLRAVRSLSDGRILVAIDGKLIELTGSEEADKKDVQVCNIGVYDYNGEVDKLELILVKYNENSEKTVFQIKNYDEISDLNLAILSGDVAMVITQDRFALNNLVKQGALTDLEKVAPKLFEKDVLIENVVDTARIDGISYYLPRFFKIGGQLITDPSMIKDGKLFETRKEFCDFITKHDSEYFKAASKEYMFTTFAGDLDEWIDWEAGTCHFDDGTFVDILEFCNQGATQEELADHYDWWVANAESQYWTAYVTRSFTQGETVEDYRFTDLQKALEYQKSLPLEGKSNLVQVDFPMPSAVHDGFEIIAENFFAIIDREESRDAAGDFLTWLILEDVADYSDDSWAGMWTFSINREETDQGLRQHIGEYIDVQAKLDAMDDERKKSTYGVNNTYLTFQMHNARCGEEQYDVTWDYIHNADHFRYSNNEIFKVMKAEAANYFGGLCTAKQAAEYVQNRISLYLAEQS
ncbi:MAG: hypothetical protein IJF34_12330 [Clostridia bacterium]|nr:hypothetical protein [Clostridia bacterium]MBQ4623601.1 hypothetical protein [Clostridia bacterium]